MASDFSVAWHLVTLFENWKVIFRVTPIIAMAAVAVTKRTKL
jgi:hypothetical protein